MKYQDKTDYQFAAPNRRVLARQAEQSEEPVDLDAAGKQFAERLETFFEARDVTVDPAITTANQARAVTIRATLPSDATRAAGAAPAVEGMEPDESMVRTALLRFGSGPVVELTLYAATTDTGAEAEFRRLLDSATPADLADPVGEVSRAIEAGPTGHADQQAGAIRLALTPDYRGPTAFTLATDDGTVRFRLSTTAPQAEVVRRAEPGPILATGVGVGVAEDGSPVRYELGPRPRLSPGRRPAAPAPQAKPEAFRGGPVPAVEPGAVRLDAEIRGIPAQVLVDAQADNARAEELGRELIQSLNNPR